MDSTVTLRAIRHGKIRWSAMKTTLAKGVPHVVLATMTLGYAVWCLWAVLNTAGTFGWDAKRLGVLKSVDAGGPAWRAGLRPGDVILAADGVPVERASGLFTSKEPGDKSVLLVERDGQVREATLQLSQVSLGVVLSRLGEVALALCFWLVGVAALVCRSREEAPRRFFWTSQAGAATLLSQFSVFYWWPGLFWMVDVSVPLLAATTLALFTVFPMPLTELAGRRIRVAAYIWCGSVVAWGLWKSVSSGPMGGGHGFSTVRDGTLFLALVGSLYLMIRRRQRTSPLSRLRRRILIAGLVVSFGVQLLLSFGPELILGRPWVGWAWTDPLAFLLPVCFWWALTSGHLGRTEMKVNRSLLRLVVSGIIALLWLGAWAAARAWDVSEDTREIAMMAVAVVGAWSFGWLTRLIGGWLDGVIYDGGWPEYRNVVLKATAELSAAGDLEELSGKVMGITKEMHFDQACVLWLSEDGGGMPVPAEYGAVARLTARAFQGYPEGDPARWWLRAEGPLGAYLAARGDLVRREQMRTSLAVYDDGLPLEEGERAMLGAEGAVYWMPLATRRKLYGVLVVGEREVDHQLASEDRDILKTVADAAALAGANLTMLGTLRERVSDVMDAEEAQRGELAGELHDGPLGRINRILFLLATLKRARPNIVGDRDLERVYEGLRAASAELRGICGGLLTTDLDDGLAEAVTEHARTFREQHHELDLRLDLQGDQDELTKGQRWQLYRIYQEALRNAAKHADATLVCVKLNLDGRYAVLEISDNGRGFDAHRSWGELCREGHFGLRNIWHRAKSLGGELSITSSCTGTVIRATIPLANMATASAAYLEDHQVRWEEGQECLM